MKPLLAAPSDPVPKSLRAGALLLALYVAGVHVALADDRYHQQPYVGALFAAGAMGLMVGAAIAAGGRGFGRPVVVAAWTMGAVIAAAMFVGFLLSRTVGLPGYHRSDWPAVQVIALVVEIAYLAAYAVAIRRLAAASERG